MSGLSHTPGKRARGYTLRGFESRLLRQKSKAPQTSCLRGFLFFCRRQWRGARVRKPHVAF